MKIGFLSSKQFLIGALFLAVILTVSFGCTPSHALQTVPYKMNFQGRLTDASGNPEPDGLYDITFRIYDASTGGTLQWSEVRDTTNRVQVTGGLFSVQLGDVTSLPPSIFTNQNLYFEVELPSPATATCSTAGCASYTEGPMTPRSKLGTSAYAFNADQIDGIDGSSLARVDAANTFSSTNTFSGALTVNAASTFNGNVTVASGYTATNNGTLVVTDAGSTGSVTVNSSGITLAGNARKTKTLRLSAEYGGAVLDAGSLSNNTGSMTSGFDLANRMNYYKWTTTSATPQNYDVVVEVPVPSDFDSWASTNALTLTAMTSDTTNGTVTLEARDTAGTVVTGLNFVSVTPGATGTWSTAAFNGSSMTGTYTPGGYITLRMRMQSPLNGDVRIGNITLNYLTKY